MKKMILCILMILCLLLAACGQGKDTVDSGSQQEVEQQKDPVADFYRYYCSQGSDCCAHFYRRHRV